jgi:hypothetical protein
MTTKKEIINQLMTEFPTLRIGDDNVGYTDLTAEEYEATISEWADAKLAKEAEEFEVQAKAQAKVVAQAKLAALGLTVEDLTALGL